VKLYFTSLAAFDPNIFRFHKHSASYATDAGREGKLLLLPVWCVHSLSALSLSLYIYIYLLLPNLLAHPIRLLSQSTLKVESARCSETSLNSMASHGLPGSRQCCCYVVQLKGQPTTRHTRMDDKLVVDQLFLKFSPTVYSTERSVALNTAGVCPEPDD
jgi:hypothetical protein